MILQSRIEESYTDFTDSTDFLGKKSVFSVFIRVPKFQYASAQYKLVKIREDSANVDIRGEKSSKWRDNHTCGLKRRT